MATVRPWRVNHGANIYVVLAVSREAAAMFVVTQLRLADASDVEVVGTSASGWIFRLEDGL